ncbi:MAG: glycosyltransferase family 9 protein [Sphingobacteriia bacterium]|jgi:ADP-heptose:LPS heptosyltransferase
MQKILVIQTAFIGDAILATAVANKLKQHYPQAQVHYLVRQGNEGLLTHHPSIDQVWVWVKKKHKLRNLLRLALRLRQHQWDLVVNLHRFGTSGLLTWLQHARYKVGYRKNPFSFAYTWAAEHPIGQQQDAHWLHETARNQVLIAPWTDEQPARPSLHPSPEDQAAVAPYQQQPYVVLAPASVWATKQWPEARWRQLLELLPPTLTAYLVGAPSDEPLCSRLAHGLPHAQVLAGQLSLMQTTALMQQAMRVFANDSAPLHLASSVNAPTTTFFCSTIPQFGFGPLADDQVVLETPEPLVCRPCGLHGRRACPLGHFACGYGISAQQALATLPGLPEQLG